MRASTTVERARKQNGGIFVILGLAVVVQVGAIGGNYHYFGCYEDKVSDPDFNGQVIPYPTFDIDKCAAECIKFGHPYFGVKAMKKCQCGDQFGKHGLSTNPVTCNYTCDTSLPCGGVLSNDVYYAPKKDSASKATRQKYIKTTGKTFDAARSDCVAGDGDLLQFTQASELAAIQTFANSKGIKSGKYWQGIWKQATTYLWVDPTTSGAISTTHPLWKAGETHANLCVVFDLETGKWETASCKAHYPFICLQDPPTVAPTEDTPEETTGTGDGDGGFDMSKLSLYIVLPLFGLCYGGSCILYCSHKIYKSFKRKKRQKMLLSRMEEMPDNGTEYEPHNKPKYEPQKPGSGNGRPFSASKRATVYPIAAPPPIQNGYFMKAAPPPGPPPSERNKTPVEDIKIPSPRGEPEGEQAEEEPIKEEERPDTTRDVKISMAETARESPPIASSPMMDSPPQMISPSTIATAAVAVDAMRNPPPVSRSGTQSAKTKTEIRREKLLRKALEEARNRRRQEGTPVPGDMPPPADNQWAAPTHNPRNSPPKYDDDSGDSTVNLLSDNERGRSADNLGRDPTTMSIQEILRMKVSMKQSKRRPKKILSA